MINKLFSVYFPVKSFKSFWPSTQYFIVYSINPIPLLQSGEEEEQVEKTRSTRSHDEDDRFAPWSWEQVSSLYS